MIAYKGFTENLWSVMGDGKKETCRFLVGETKTVENSRTARSGFHCCENPFDCLSYYGFDGKNRFFEVMADGDIDEDERGRIACTRITLLEELTQVKFAMAGMRYIIEHPDRDGWEQNHGTVIVAADKAEAKTELSIAIARGSSPKVRGPEGSILGLIVEDTSGIRNAKLISCTGATAGRWLRINANREVEVIEEETH